MLTDYLVWDAYYLGAADGIIRKLENIFWFMGA